MKKFFSTLIAIIIVSAVCALIAYFFGDFQVSNAISIGISAGIGGFLAPLIVAWIQKQFK